MNEEKTDSYDKKQNRKIKMRKININKLIDDFPKEITYDNKKLYLKTTTTIKTNPYYSTNTDIRYVDNSEAIVIEYKNIDKFMIKRIYYDLDNTYSARVNVSLEEWKKIKK